MGVMDGWMGGEVDQGSGFVDCWGGGCMGNINRPLTLALPPFSGGERTNRRTGWLRGMSDGDLSLERAGQNGGNKRQAAAGVLVSIVRSDPSGRYSLKTAGAASRIELLADATTLRANGKDAGHVEFRIVDAQGVRVPNVEAEVTFEITGPARLIGIGNVDLQSTESGKTNRHQTFQGRGLAILQTTATPGEIVVKATAPGLEAGQVTVQSR